MLACIYVFLVKYKCFSLLLCISPTWTISLIKCIFNQNSQPYGFFWRFCVFVVSLFFRKLSQVKMIHTSEFKINNGEKLQEIIPECCFQSYFCCPQPLLVTISSSKSPLIGHKLTISSSPLQAVDVSSESNHSLPTSTISLFRSPGCRWYRTTSSYGAAKVLQQLPGHRA